MKPGEPAQGKGRHFPRALRMLRRQDFLAAREHGRKFHTSHFLVFIFTREDRATRLGITVSRKVGGAVVRNRVKRRVREFFRLYRGRLPVGIDLSVVAKKGAGDLDFDAVCREIEGALKRKKSP